MKFPILLLTFYMYSILGYGQEQGQNKFVLGLIEKIQSTSLNETRSLNIYLPDGYDSNPSVAYPVIYLLDGSANEDFIHVTGIVQFLTMIEAMPKSIVVGISNIDRQRDFTFPTDIDSDKKAFPTTGGSAKFITFIAEELQPFLQKRYRTNHSKTIIGQSLGGLLATEILVKNPSLFTNYIIVSPSLWWNNESLLAEVRAMHKEQISQPVHVFISVGTEGRQMEDDVKNLANMLGKTGIKNLETYFVPLPAENHLTILHNAVYLGFKQIFHKKQP